MAINSTISDGFQQTYTIMQRSFTTVVVSWAACNAPASEPPHPMCSISVQCGMGELFEILFVVMHFDSVSVCSVYCEYYTLRRLTN